MTNEKYIDILQEKLKYAKTYKYTEEDISEAFEKAIKALESQPCEDAISRADVISLVNKGYLVSNSNYKSVCDVINALPSVTPQPKRGHWTVIRKEYEFMGGIVNESQGCKCSNCGGIVRLKSDFCPNCGADMREVNT